MRLVFYSGGEADDNEEIDLELVSLLGTANPKVTFIPTSREHADDEYEEFLQHFSPYGFDRFSMFQIDRPFTNFDAENAINSDLIFLNGGNTYYFLQQIQKSKFGRYLARYVEEDKGVLAGLSAGAIIMTHCINTAGMPEFDRDDNDVELKNLRSLNLVNFEFFPHYVDSKKYVRAFIEYTKTRHRPLYCCTDGSGIIINGDQMSFIGWVWGFVRGQKFMLTPR